MSGMNTEFLQSEEWLRLQEATGRSTVRFKDGDFGANGIVHRLPLVGKYLYVPRGPVQNNLQSSIFNFQKNIKTLVGAAREKGVKWVRVEPETEEMLEEIKKSVSYQVVRAPHDMQPREVFKIDITLPEDALLANMKPKTRYNIRLAEKHGVRVFETREEKYITAFLDLITATSGRKGITAHPRHYYEKFFAVLPEEMCRLFVAEYEGPTSTRENSSSTRGGQVLAANMMIFFGDTATYLHGGSGDEHRDVMAPYLLQWEQIRAARARGYRLYDFGGVKTEAPDSSWAGITKFKRGFSPATTPTSYSGTYDIILDSPGYLLYDALRHIQKLKRVFIH